MQGGDGRGDGGRRGRTARANEAEAAARAHEVAAAGLARQLAAAEGRADDLNKGLDALSTEHDTVTKAVVGSRGWRVRKPPTRNCGCRSS